MATALSGKKTDQLRGSEFVRRPYHFFLLGLLAVTCVTPAAQCQWEFVKIADFSTPIPGAQGHTFDDFSTPAISDSRVAFYGRSGDFHNPNQAGIFVVEDGSFQTVADISTPIPGGSGFNFVRLDAPSINGSQVSFWGQYPGFPLQEGIYTYMGRPLQVIADVNTQIPGGVGTFANGHFSPIQSSSSGNVALVNWGPGQEGVFARIGGALRVIANLSTNIPGGQGTFAFISGSLPFDEVTLSGVNVAFVGRGSGQEGIYSTIGGSLRSEVDLNTVLPGGGGHATLLRSPSLQGEDLAFVAFGEASVEGIYIKQGGVLRVVADSHTPIPGRQASFSQFDGFASLDGGNVVFRGSPSFAQPYEGIFAYYSGSLVKVVDTNGTFDGRIVSHFLVGHQAISGYRIAFKVVFSDFSQGIFVAIAPLNFHDGFESGDTSAWLNAH